eukprot:11161836-Alexandrium_andersonii.AAC.1
MCQGQRDVFAAGAAALGGLPGAESRLNDRCDSGRGGGLNQPAQRRRQHEGALLLDQPAVALLGNPDQQLDVLSQHRAQGFVPDGGRMESLSQELHHELHPAMEQLVWDAVGSRCGAAGPEDGGLELPATRPCTVQSHGVSPAIRLQEGTGRLGLGPASVPNIAAALPEYVEGLAPISRECAVGPVDLPESVLALHPGSSEPDWFAAAAVAHRCAPRRVLPARGEGAVLSPDGEEASCIVTGVRKGGTTAGHPLGDAGSWGSGLPLRLSLIHI